MLKDFLENRKMYVNLHHKKNYKILSLLFRDKSH